MAEAAAADRGTWRNSAFVRVADIFVFVEAALVWMGLIVLAIAITLAVAERMQLPQYTLYEYLGGLWGSYAFKQALTASYYLVLLFFLWRIARRVSTAALAARFRAMPFARFAMAVLAGMALGLAIPMLNAYLMARHGLDLKITEAERMAMPQQAGQWPYAFLMLGLMAPFVEEFYFRGIILGWLTRKLPVILAVAANAVLFGLIHFDFVDHPGAGGWYITAVLAGVGAIAAVLALKTKSLWAPFGLHAGYNTTLVSLPVLAQLLR